MGALYESWRHGETVPAYEAAVRLDPTNPDTYEELGLALDRTGRYAEGKDCRDKAAELRRVKS